MLGEVARLIWISALRAKALRLAAASGSKPLCEKGLYARNAESHGDPGCRHRRLQWLAGADEERTIGRLRALRSDLIDPTIALHNGRLVKRTGDGAVVEFRSVVEAARAAIEVQTSKAERNAGGPADKRIQARVGIHLGDVIEEADGDLMGDAVNVAARLESICEPGGICLSEDAYRQVRDKLQVRFSDLGEQHLKNIVRPVRAYALRLGVAVSAPAVGRKARNEAPVGSVRAAAFVAVLIAA